MELIKIAFAGNSENFEAYKKVLDRYDENVVFSGAWFPADKPEWYTGKEYDSLDDLLKDADAVIFLGKVRRKIITDTIKALKHIFIEDYDVLMNPEVKYISDLTVEAKIMAQVSFPKIYFWGIEDIVEEYPAIRHIFFTREYLYLQQRHEVDIIPEIMSSIMLAGEDVVRANQSFYPMISKRTEMHIVNLEFVTKATSTITGIPVGFFEKHDLRIIAERNLAYIDLRKREWHSLRPARAINGNLIKGLAGLPEVGDLEQFELQDFIYSIQENSKPFISLDEIVRLHNCVKLLNDE
jgi:hypothetical protein